MVEYSRIKVVTQGDKLVDNRLLESGMYIVATPIGNMRDITLRALDTLNAVDLIACEDTRVTNKLLCYHNIKKSLLVYNDHSSQYERDKIVNLIQSGKSIALVSDAGSPLIADPGFKLIRLLKLSNINIEVIPGPCSLIAALSISGLATDRFLFCGFVSKKKSEIRKEFEAAKEACATLIFFVTANDLTSILAEAIDIFGDRECTVVRELTKVYEESKLGTLSEVLTFYQINAPRGELILLISGKKKATEDTQEFAKQLLICLSNEMTLKDAVTEVAKQCNIQKREVYKMALALGIFERPQTDQQKVI